MRIGGLNVKSGWNNKNTLNFGFDENGKHIIFNMDGEIIDTDLEKSPFCQLQWKLFKDLYPTKESYETAIREVKQLSQEDKKAIVDMFVDEHKKFIQRLNIYQEE